jgi:hypothetical protein
VRQSQKLTKISYSFILAGVQEIFPCFTSKRKQIEKYAIQSKRAFVQLRAAIQDR